MSLLSRRSKSTNKAARRKRPLSRPDFELLEDRRLLAPLNPLDFLSLGAFPTAPGTYTIDTNGPIPSLSGPGNVSIRGEVSNGIAVFDFTTINIGGGETITASGAYPLALLSRSDITINGTIDLIAPGGSEPGPGGFGGGFSGPGSGGFGPGGGGAEGPPPSAFRSPPTAQRLLTASMVEAVVGASVALVTLAGLLLSLTFRGAPQGDPAGVPMRTFLASSKAAVAAELVSTYLGAGAAARSSSVLSATSLSMAQSWPTVGGASSFYAGGGGGGGAGGGILLHGEGVTLSGLLSAIGGNGGSGGSDGRNYPYSVAEWGSGGNGGGGQVVIDPGAGGFSGSLTTSINVSGGAGGGPGAAAGGLGQVAIIGPFVVTNTNDSGIGSLRQAILNANANPGLDTIDFAIPGAGVHTISPASALPGITDPVVIDGYTQPGSSPNTLPDGNNAVLLIELDGSNAGASVDGLVIAGGGSTVRGLVINRFVNGAINIVSDNNAIEGNFIGTDPSGTVALGILTGVTIDRGSGNTVGGTTPAARNLISGNSLVMPGLGRGVRILEGSSNVIAGNYIGTDASGTRALPNSDVGVLLDGVSTDNTIGGTTTGARNVISGNGTNGVEIINAGSTRNLVAGNYIGIDAAGSAALGNGTNGVLLDAAAGNTVGGTGTAANTIGGNVTGINILGSGPPATWCWATTSAPTPAVTIWATARTEC